MPYGYTPPNWPNTSQSGGGGWSPGAGRDESGYRPDQPINAVADTQIVPDTSVDTGDGRSAAIQTAQEDRRLRNIQQLKSLYASTMSSPGPLGGALYEDLDLATVFGSFGGDPTAMRNEDGTLHSSMDYANMPSKGQIPITDWDKLNYLHHLGIGTNVTGEEGLGAFFQVDSAGNAVLDSSGNLIKTGLGKEMSNRFNEIVYGTPSTFNPEEQMSMEEQFKKLEEDYRGGFDQRFYGMDDFDWNYYGGRPKSGVAQEMSWGAIPLSEIESVPMSEMVSQYAPEFKDRVASLHYAPHQPAEGLAYLGRPEFGTRLFDYS